MSLRTGPTSVYRAAVLGRILLAAFGGYAVAALATGLLALVLPMSRSEAVTTATLLSFAVMVAVVVAVFAVRSVGRAAALVIGLATPLAGGLWLAGAFTG
ncbi:iron transporter [Methylobacterium radiodurans]|uniref:Iron transporter n=1 Tax=Methylobacterium radiodurans TaxID=2202828 RepID=A0A2U8VWF8_9HYPH|nr:iron transporter [Methylobacterium radiodurans]AWN38159.1 iron transporter [Methylobacterium radiodurans]